MVAKGTQETDAGRTVKELKDVFDLIDRVTKLEGELQQQLAKTDSHEQRRDIATELANAAGARKKLAKARADLLGSLNA
jgi:hypothetical protein